ncbi:hypothetical protein ACFO5K_19775 [Nocardia halotolerans]|uniref:Uncharacterized protein n=1 Tax=Nocardia halotolerans TaxID=1755878 RepID=A0ABV8VNU8_9NOCA
MTERALHSAGEGPEQFKGTAREVLVAGFRGLLDACCSACRFAASFSAGDFGWIRSA